MPVSSYHSLNHSRIYFPQFRNLYQSLPVQWVCITAMAVFFFPLTMTIILFNEAGLGLMLAALISICLVVITNLLPLSEKYIRMAFGIGICIDLGVVVVSFIIK